MGGSAEAVEAVVEVLFPNPHSKKDSAEKQATLTYFGLQLVTVAKPQSME